MIGPHLSALCLGVCEELGIGFVAYGAVGRGLLTGVIGNDTSLDKDDIRLEMPRFQGENRTANLALVERLKELAGAERCTPAQLAIAWVLSRRPWIVPIVGTSNPDRLAENAAAASLTISDSTLRELERVFPPGAVVGDRTVPVLMPRLGL
jgi:aryl-alcohol dehydrogenase-like predicted oxidoreductase